jgi:hypothetical protein
MKTRSDLVEVVSGTNAPFPVVSVHHVGNVVELRWISFSFGGLGTIRSVVGSLCENVLSIITLRRHESLVVVARLVILAEAEL